MQNAFCTRCDKPAYSAGGLAAAQAGSRDHHHTSCCCPGKIACQPSLVAVDVCDASVCTELKGKECQRAGICDHFQCCHWCKTTPIADLQGIATVHRCCSHSKSASQRLAHPTNNKLQALLCTLCTCMTDLRSPAQDAHEVIKCRLNTS